MLGDSLRRRRQGKSPRDGEGPEEDASPGAGDENARGDEGAAGRDPDAEARASGPGLGDALRGRPRRRSRRVWADRSASLARAGLDWARGPGAPWLLGAVVVLVGSFVTGYLISTQILFPRPETAGTGIAVPSLYGEQRSAAETAIRSAGLEIGEVTELANREVERGRVLAQDPVPGQQLRQGGVVSFAVSGGAPVIRVPPVRGLGVDAARELLDSVGFDVAVGQLRDPRLPAGTVARVEPAAGTQRELPSGVTLFVVPEAVTDSLEPGVAPVGEGGSVPDTGSAGPTPAPRVGDGAG